MTDEHIFNVVDAGNALRRIKAEASPEEWASCVAENFPPGEEGFADALVKFAEEMSDDPAYSDSSLARILLESGARIRMGLHSPFYNPNSPARTEGVP